MVGVGTAVFVGVGVGVRVEVLVGVAVAVTVAVLVAAAVDVGLTVGVSRCGRRGSPCGRWRARRRYPATVLSAEFPPVFETVTVGISY